MALRANRRQRREHPQRSRLAACGKRPFAEALAIADRRPGLCEVDGYATSTQHRHEGQRYMLALQYRWEQPQQLPAAAPVHDADVELAVIGLSLRADQEPAAVAGQVADRDQPCLFQRRAPSRRTQHSPGMA